MVKKKGKSNRKTLKQKYKIEKKVKEHKRKLRKAARQKGPMKKKAELGAQIPSQWPFKEQLLQEIETAKRVFEKKQKAKKEQRKRDRLNAKKRLTPDVNQSIENMLDSAAKRAKSFEQQSKKKSKLQDAGQDEHSDPLGQQSRRAFLRELKKVVEHSDVVLQVLDARDPLGSRAQQVEDMVLRSANKRLVYVLNKVDLVPRDAVVDWLAYLRRQHPTVAFKCATQDNASHLSQRKGKAEDTAADALKRSGSVGAEALMQLLKNYSRCEGGVKRTLSVGVVGYPNVGKSSLINSLKRTKSVGVSPTPGFTRSMQEINLDKNIRLLDCPGIVFDDSDSKSVLLKNCVDPDALEDPFPAVEALLERTAPEALMQLYQIPAFDPKDSHSFLAHAARKKGKLLKGGIPNYPATAKAVLKDWNSGKVPFYTPVPEDVHTKGLEGEAQIVESFSEAFHAENMMETDAKVIDALPDSKGMTFVKVQARENTATIAGMDEDEDGSESEEEEAPKLVSLDMSNGSKIQDQGGDSMEGVQTSGEINTVQQEDELNPQINQQKKKALKAQKKKKKKQQKSLNQENDGMDEDYSFERDFYGKQNNTAEEDSDYDAL
mmetsp:Transcript_38828/g.49566  ORF Transcript_38828/g.49566 Transcript_38828/m.49566 type:complete len:603 (+) Transcript_38828:102-1910(+)